MKRLITMLIMLPLTAVMVLSAAPVLADSIIVQLDKAPGARYVAQERAAGRTVSDAALETYRAELRADQDDFLEALDARGVSFVLETVQIPDFEGNVTPIEVRYTLVFNGVALDVPESAVTTIEQMPQVRKVFPNRLSRLHLDHSVDYIRAPAVYGAIKELTPFDDFREGFEGQGINISVIDTGIEWSHEMFGADATPPRLGLQSPLAAADSNEKVIYYLPLHENAIDDFGHGTHASADAAGYQGFSPGPDGTPLTGDDVPIHGVAPQARLMGYKVCSGVGSAAGVFGCLTTSIILAIEDSVSPRTLNGFPKPVAHVINLSLGGAGGPDSPTAVASDNAVLLGTIVVASAGNEGPGEATVGAPAAGRHVIAVGANNDPGVIPNSITVPDRSDTATIPASMAPDSNLGTKIQEPIVASYVFAGRADTPDQVPLAVAGNICLAVRGSTVDLDTAGTGLFANKAAQCEAKGAVATVIFNNAPEEIGPVLAPASRPVFTISGLNGQFLLDLGFDANGISNFVISLNPEDPSLFEAMMAGFSSRGPVEGFGQVKPDVTAPGVDVLSATSPVGVPVLSMQSETRYTSASGTSFSGPHVTGMAALVKQAHLDWTPDMVRTALINTATNLRDPGGTPKPDGLDADPILAQGGGLIDVFEAVNAKALMGVAGDGIEAPGILGSHSFGTVPVVNSRVTHTESVEVAIRDAAGEGGTYNLRVANNRNLQLDGIDVSLSATSVPAGGTFTVNVSIDGDVIRSTETETIQLQFYVIAERADGGEILRMPFYLKPTPSVPAEVQSVEQQTFEDVMPASDTNLQLIEDVTFKDFPVEVEAATFRLNGDLSFDELAGGLPDMDLFLLDPDGAVVASSTNAGGPEHITLRPGRTGTFTWRVTGWVSAATPFKLDSIQELGGEPPVLEAFEGDFTDSQGRPVDFDGDLTLEWRPIGNPISFEIERSIDGGDFELVAEAAGDVTSLTLSDQPEGELAFRMKALFPGQIGFFVSAPSAQEIVVVDRREQVNITNRVGTAISDVSFDGGVFQLDLRMTNEATQDFVPLVEFNIVRIESASGTVEVINADNGGSGTSRQDPALFDYSHQLGNDDTFSAGETSGPRTMQFRDEAAELFTFDAVVTAFKQVGESAAEGGSATGGGSTTDSDDGLDEAVSLLRYTVNPLTGSVEVELITDLL